MTHDKCSNATKCAMHNVALKKVDTLQHTATHCSTLQYTATHCNAQQQVLHT